MTARLPALRRHVFDAMPRGRTLPEAEWRRRHRGMIWLLWLHAVALPLYGMARGEPAPVAGLAVIPIGALALAGTWEGVGRRLRTVFVSVGLLTCSALAVAMSNGVTEAHFHFFLVMVILTLYEDWLPFCIAVGYVTLHHGLLGSLLPHTVFSHEHVDQGTADVWLWAAVHGAFVMAVGAAAVIAWRLNEGMRADTHAALRRARMSEQRFRGTFNHAPIGKAVTGLDSTIQRVNPAFCALVGQTEDALVGRSIARDIAAEPLSDRDAEFVRAVTAGERSSYTYETRFRHAAGHAVWVEVSMSRVAGDEQLGAYTILQVQDITSRKQAETKLRHAFERERQMVHELHELDRVRSDFVGSISHELRTPLTSIIGYVGMVLGGRVGPVDPVQQEMLEIADRNAKRLLALIEDLLTLSRIESGTFRVELEPTDLRPIIQHVHDSLRPMLEDRDLEFVVDCGGDGRLVRGDGAQLERVVTNLVTNAVKFTPDGGRVEVRLASDRRGVVLEVSDTGIGIPRDEQEQLFARFFRSTEARVRQIQGTGLGLAIVKSIVDHHGGTIHLDSTPGEGTTVRVVLSPAPVEQPMARSGAS